MVKLPRYNSPTTQVVLVSFVCFATVGMYGALNNLGAGGTQNIVLSDITNAVLYTCFALFALVSGSINNILGPRLTLFIGSFGYLLYVVGLWVYQTRGIQWFLILTGAILGLGAAMLWSAQGAVMMSYPLEKDKGRMFSVFWVIFNAGGLMGGLIALGIDLKQGALSATATTTYVAFMIVMGVGIAACWTLLPPGRVVRNDGTIVKIQSFANPKDEVRGLWNTLKEPQILLLVPLFFFSNYFYSYQSALAVAIFDATTRAVNGVVKSTGQIVGAIIIGILLDVVPVKRRRNRGLIGVATATAFICVAYGWGLAYQLRFTRATEPSPKINYADAAFGEPIALLVFYDVADAMYQGVAYWIMGALSADAFVLARYAGLYKALQSAGSAVAYGVDAVKTPLLNELLSGWICLLFSLAPAFYVAANLHDTNLQAENAVHVGDTIIGSDGREHVAGEKDLDKDTHAHVVVDTVDAASDKY
ncbi:hypothetical protein Q5752_004545 [Cryptotrichosporon argae]